MSLPYRDGDLIAEVEEFLRNGGDPARAAAYLRVNVEDLPRLGLPVEASKPAQSTEIDLRAADKLQEVL